MVNKNKIVAIIQARLTSSRFPNKVMQKIGNFTILEMIQKRLSKSKLIDEIVFCVPSNYKNRRLYDFLKKLKFQVTTGSENNVLNRYFKTALKYKASTIVRITGDSPFPDSKLIDKMIKKFQKESLDYLTSASPPSFPDGLDAEIFSFATLKTANQNVTKKFDLEHVTPYIKKSNKFKKNNIKLSKDLSFIKLSVDVPNDIKNIKKIFNHFSPNIYFSIDQLLKNNLYQKLFKKDFNKLNYLNNKTKNGQKLWNIAKKVIPGGNMLISKNPDRYLPDVWPTYYKSAKGCLITDLDNNKYIDFSTMGIGTNVLGYGNKFIDSAVKKVISKSNMSTLNCPEEVSLAEKLIELHPWFQMVRFARTGGEANSIAIRIARAASGRDNVAICGYHGWHDWYLSANINHKDGKNLDGHLLTGLEISGVPKKLKNTVFPFSYGDIGKIKEIIKKHNIGVIKMEVCRNTFPDIKFLREIKRLTNKHNIVLIFDECTTGFRQSLGGLHKTIDIAPDIAIFGKALGNGYAITAIVGKKHVMEASQKTFISSTFWTERIGSTAGLKTIQFMEDNKTWVKINEIGKKIQKGWSELAKYHNLKINIKGIPSLASFNFSNGDNQFYKTLITQEMLKNNFLAATSVYCCIKHDSNILNKYFDKLSDVFKIIKRCEEGFEIRHYLKSKVSIKEFKRLN